MCHRIEQTQSKVSPIKCDIKGVSGLSLKAQYIHSGPKVTTLICQTTLLWFTFLILAPASMIKSFIFLLVCYDSIILKPVSSSASRQMKRKLWELGIMSATTNFKLLCWVLFWQIVCCHFIYSLIFNFVCYLVFCFIFIKFYLLNKLPVSLSISSKNAQYYINPVSMDGKAFIDDKDTSTTIHYFGKSIQAAVMWFLVFQTITL